MGSFEPAQIAKLVEIYILDMIGRFLNLNNVGIYGDDDLISILDSNGPLTSKIQKEVIRVFRYMGLKIEIISN